MQIDLESVKVENNKEARRFEARVDDYFALIDYIPAGRNIVFTHTEVPKIFENQGVASKMAKVALEYARANELKVIPLCPFVAAYIRRHAEYQPLVWAANKILEGRDKE